MQTASAPTPEPSPPAQIPLFAGITDPAGLRTPLKSVPCYRADPCDGIPFHGILWDLLVLCLLTPGASGLCDGYPLSIPEHKLPPPYNPFPSSPWRPARGTGLVFSMGKDGRIRPLQRLDGASTRGLWSPCFNAAGCREPGLGFLPCPSSSRLHSHRDPLLAAASAAF